MIFLTFPLFCKVLDISKYVRSLRLAFKWYCLQHSIESRLSWIAGVKTWHLEQWNGNKRTRLQTPCKACDIVSHLPDCSCLTEVLLSYPKYLKMAIGSQRSQERITTQKICGWRKEKNSGLTLENAHLYNILLLIWKIRAVKWCCKHGISWSNIS